MVLDGGHMAKFTVLFPWFNFSIAVRAITLFSSMRGVGLDSFMLRHGFFCLFALVVLNRDVESICPEIGTMEFVFGKPLKSFASKRVSHLTDPASAFYNSHVSWLSKVIHHCF
jgi:hypothetical protein